MVGKQWWMVGKQFSLYWMWTNNWMIQSGKIFYVKLENSSLSRYKTGVKILLKIIKQPQGVYLTRSLDRKLSEI